MLIDNETNILITVGLVVVLVIVNIFGLIQEYLNRKEQNE